MPRPYFKTMAQRADHHREETMKMWNEMKEAKKPMTRMYPDPQQYYRMRWRFRDLGLIGVQSSEDVLKAAALRSKKRRAILKAIKMESEQKKKCDATPSLPLMASTSANETAVPVVKKRKRTSQATKKDQNQESMPTSVSASTKVKKSRPYVKQKKVAATCDGPEIPSTSLIPSQSAPSNTI